MTEVACDKHRIGTIIVLGADIAGGPHFEEPQLRFGKPVYQHEKESEVTCDAAGGLGVHAEASKDRKGGNVDLCLQLFIDFKHHYL